MLLSKQQEDTDSNLDNMVRVFFTSPTKVFSTLTKSIPDLNKIDLEDFSIGQLYICDLSVHRDTLLASTIYDSMKWFDHHEMDLSEQYDSEIENIELVLDPMASSATSVICNYFKLDNEFSKIADEIDSNNVKSENAKRIREIIGAITLKYSGFKLKTELCEFAQELAKDINSINNESYDPLIEEYNKWQEELNKYADDNVQSHSINKHKIGILEFENAAPIYSICNHLKEHSEAPFDVMAIMIHKYFRIGKDRNNKYKNKRYTKLEFRTHTDQGMLELAKLFDGGGLNLAGSATIMDGLSSEDLLKTMTTYFSPQ